MKSNKLELLFSKDIYKKEEILKAIYQYGNKYLFDITSDSKNYKLIVEFNEEKKNDFISSLSADIKSKVHDFQLRKIIKEETKELKIVILGKALSTLDIYDDVAEKIWP